MSEPLTREMESALRQMVERAPDHVHRNVRLLLDALKAERAAREKAERERELAVIDLHRAQVDAVEWSAQVNGLREALYGIVSTCLDANALEELGEVDMYKVEAARRALGDCEACAGWGTVDRQDHADEVIAPDNLCPGCGGRGYVAALAPQVNALRDWARFGAWAFEMYWQDGCCGDIDGGDAQEMAVECGLLRRRGENDGNLECGEGCDWLPGQPLDECRCLFPTRKPLYGAPAEGA